MAFKMKAGKGGPMKKNFPSAFKDTIAKRNIKEEIGPRYTSQIMALNPLKPKKVNLNLRKPIEKVHTRRIIALKTNPPKKANLNLRKILKENLENK